MTDAPARWANCTAQRPTAPAPPCTRTVRPSTGPAACTQRCAVMPGIPRQAPCCAGKDCFMLARPDVLLRIEGAAMFASSLLLYRFVGARWAVFFVLFL